VPVIASIGGRATATNVISAATGLPGRPINGVLPIWPSATGRPGLIASRQKNSDPCAFMMSRT
jgi:hypothetical protein